MDRNFFLDAYTSIKKYAKLVLISIVQWSVNCGHMQLFTHLSVALPWIDLDYMWTTGGVSQVDVAHVATEEAHTTNAGTKREQVSHNLCVQWPVPGVP